MIKSTPLRSIASVVPQCRLIGDGDRLIHGIAYDSRAVQSGDLFVCIEGLQWDGHDFAVDAVKKGSTALLVSRELPVDIPQLVVSDTRYAMGIASAYLFGQPSEQLNVIGVTGTNGKTTSSYLIRDALSGDGDTCGLIGTIEQWTGNETRPASRTTPESPDIQRLLREMVDVGARAGVMEVSSHGLALKRTVGTGFHIAVLTNISRDHFDFHGTFESYVNAKLELFRSLSSERDRQGVAIVNGDDRLARRFIETATSGWRAATIVTYGLGLHHDVVAEDVDVNDRYVAYTVRTPGGSARIRLSLPGQFNVYNSLAAIAVATNLGIDVEKAATRLRKTVVPGRFEPIPTGRGFSVFVDYAHTPDSVENALKTARQMTDSKVIVVIGAGGDRDPGKRPIMGRVAAEHADIVFFTADNPRSEDPQAICNEMASGVSGAKQIGTDVSIVVDREEAIHAAINAAGDGDVVLIAGKGHETYQEVQGQQHFFDDREVARRALRAGMSS